MIFYFYANGSGSFFRYNITQQQLKENEKQTTNILSLHWQYHTRKIDTRNWMWNQADLSSPLSLPPSFTQHRSQQFFGGGGFANTNKTVQECCQASVAKCTPTIFLMQLFVIAVTPNASTIVWGVRRIMAAGLLKIAKQIFVLWPQWLDAVHTPTPAHSPSFPTFEMQAALVSHRAHLRPLLICAIWTHAGTSFLFSPLPFPRLSLALRRSFHFAPAMIKDSFVTPSEASRRRQKTSNRPPQRSNNSQKNKKEREGRLARERGRWAHV